MSVQKNKSGINERDIFIDKQSGKDFNSREQYQILKRMLRENNILVIKSIDRLGRDYKMIIEEWQDITKNIKADIKVLDMPMLDTTKHKNLLGTFISDLILQVLSYVAEQERTFIKQQQKEGIIVAKSKGIKLGRPRILKPSGKDVEHRPAYQRMIKDMKDKKFNLIMALKLDRLSRSISDFEDLFKRTEKYNCGIELFSGNIDTNGATGMLFARILATFAQFEREIIQERTLIGVEAVVDKRHLGGKPALGYRKDNKIGEDGKACKVWVIDEDEAKIVREIFNLCLNGKTYFQIANIMKEKYPNILAFYRTDKKIKERIPVFRSWTDGSICTILNNRHYIGIHDFRKSVKEKDTVKKRDLVPAIIDQETFKECQKNIARNKRNYYRNKEKQYLFVQKLKCPHCGRILAANGARNKQKELYFYYKCKDCKEYVREDWVEKAMLKQLNDLLEFNYALDSSFVPMDSESAKKFN